MASKCVLFLYVLVVQILFCNSLKRYEPNWESLDSRPNPKWYDEAKFGIMMHWGVYSKPAFGVNYGGGSVAWFWRYLENGQKEFVEYMKNNYPPGFTYPDFAPMFRAEFFNPDDWADLIAKSGARYFVITSKHHEGFTLWKSNVSWNWNSVDVGPHRDLIGDLAKSIRSRTNVTFGLYHSLYEWFNPIYLEDKASNFTKQTYVNEVLMPQLYDMVNRFKPEFVWADGEWDADYEYWNSVNFITWLFNDSPVKDTVVINDRWGKNCRNKHGGVYTGGDRFNPGKFLEHKWENAMTVDKYAWAFRKSMKIDEIFTIEELIKELASTVSCGGNLLMDIGPTGEGQIAAILQERLTQMGQWLEVNGEAIYKTKAWRIQNDTVTSDIWYTSKPDAVYAIVLSWPDNNIVKLTHPVVTDTTQVSMLGLKSQLSWRAGSENVGIFVDLSHLTLANLPCQWSWVLKLENVK